MPTGRNCQSPAMRGSAFCYHHARRIPPRGKSPSAGLRVPMPATLDRHGIATALHGVLQGLADDSISARRAAVLLQGLQMAASHPEDCAPRSDLLPPELFTSEFDSDEVVAAVNVLAEKLGLNPDAAPPPSVRPKP